MTDSKLKYIIKNIRIMINNQICELIGHVDQKILIDGVHLSTCCFLRVRICKRWEMMSRAENRHTGEITWGIVR